MGDPGLLQKSPDIPPLLPEGGGDREQAAAADGAVGRLDAMADFALNHRLAQGSLGGVVGGLDPLNLQEGPEAIGHLQQLLAGAHRLGPRRALASLVAQLHHPLQRGHKRLTDRPAGQLQRGPVDPAVFVAVPQDEQLLLQVQQLRSRLTAGALTLSDGGEIADHVRPAQLPLLGGQVVVGGEAIAHDNAAKGVPEQLDRSVRRAAQALHKHRHHGGHHDPLPAASARGIAAIRIAGGGTGVIDVDHRLPAGKGDGLIHRLLQRGAQTPSDRCDRPAADLYSQ